MLEEYLNIEYQGEETYISPNINYYFPISQITLKEFHVFAVYALGQILINPKYSGYC